MPKQRRFKTDYPGVYFIEGTDIGTGKPERIYYITYRKNGKLIEEKAGRHGQDSMSPARASLKRAERIDGKALSNKERRQAQEAAKKAAHERWTFDRLALEYFKSRHQGK